MPPTEEQERGPLAGWNLERWRGTLIWWAVIAAIIIVGRVTPFKPIRGFFGGFGWLTEQALLLAKDLFESYGELTVFLAPLLENTIFLGALIPGTLVMLLAGVAIHDGLIALPLAIPLGIVGAIIGDTISYGIGRFGWHRLGPESQLVRWSERVREPLLNHSIWLVLSYHFAGYSRMIGPASAGFMRMPFLRWMLLDYLGVTLWVITFIMAGYLLGVAGLSLDDPSDREIRIFEIVLFALFAIAVVVILRRARRSGSGRAETPSAVTGTRSPDGARATAGALDPAESPSEEETPERVG